jgi:exo-beta-1,3-glucanase (GH17 family)
MNTFDRIGIKPGRAICYSGYREGQQPGGKIPTYEQVKEDLLILHGHWRYLRVYDCDEHTQTILEVIEKEKLNFKVMLGAYINAEMNNFSCPWDGGVYSQKQLKENRAKNSWKIGRLIEMANCYPEIACTLSVGNEACVEWTDHYVHEDKVSEYVERVQKGADQPVTFCENYVPWMYKLEALAGVVDFISVHTYPVWEYKHINEAIEYTKHNYYSVAEKYPDTPVVITEAGWATRSNGRGIEPTNVNEQHQKAYYEQLMEWTEKEQILTFFFEAFDEKWKGSPHPAEPEKHWGLFKINRTPKLAVKHVVKQRVST